VGRIRIDKNKLLRAGVYTLVAGVLSFLLLTASYKIFSRFYTLWFMTSNSDYAEVVVCTVKTVPLSEFKRGDFVGFYYQGREFPQYGLKKGTFVVKQIWGFPGDELKVDQQVYINGELRGTVLKTDRWGNPVPHLHFNGKIPEGKIFVMGAHPRSFDSRYYGFVSVDWGLHKCWPLF
jgi:signal peptidase I